MTVDLTPDQCEEIFHAALRAGDARGVEAALTLLAARDPHLAGLLLAQLRFSLNLARSGCGLDCNPATCVHMYDEHFPGEPSLADCSGCRCCPAGACEPGEPRGPGVCGHTCPCHQDFYREQP